MQASAGSTIKAISLQVEDFPLSRAGPATCGIRNLRKRMRIISGPAEVPCDARSDWYSNGEKTVQCEGLHVTGKAEWSHGFRPLRRRKGRRHPDHVRSNTESANPNISRMRAGSSPEAR